MMKTLSALTLMAVFLNVAPAQELSASLDHAVSANLSPSSSSGIGAGAIVQTTPAQTPDLCLTSDTAATPTRPNWDYGAATTGCGIIESDSGWLDQPMGAGVRQWMLVSSMRYGLTPKLDLRWGMTDHVSQSGGGSAPLAGVGDQWASARYRFHEQGRWTPAMALSYGIKIPKANPAKGFGTGFTDYQFDFIASRDLGKNHLDFNTVGTLAGELKGHDGAPQFGLAETRQISKKLAWSLESYGGPQPGTSDRYGAGLAGVSYALRPRLVLDGAYVKVYTASAARQQFSFGLTYAMRPRLRTVPAGSRVASLLGR